MRNDLSTEPIVRVKRAHVSTVIVVVLAIGGGAWWFIHILDRPRFAEPDCNWDEVVCYSRLSHRGKELDGSDREWAVAFLRRAFELPDGAVRVHDWTSHRAEFFFEITCRTPDGEIVMTVGQIATGFVVIYLGEQNYFETNHKSYVGELERWWSRSLK